MEARPLLGLEIEEAPIKTSRNRVYIAVFLASCLALASLRVSISSEGTKLSAAGSKVHQPASGNDAVVASTEESIQPHIILFTVDDLGWNDFGLYSTDLPEATPFMSELAKKGVLITKYYTQPSCTPSRVTMMTGKYAYRNGFQNYELQHVDQVGVPLSNKLMPAYMKDLGYSTHMLGKWNIGHCSSKYLPHERGFDHFLGYLCPGHGYTVRVCAAPHETPLDCALTFYSLAQHRITLVVTVQECMTCLRASRL